MTPTYHRMIDEAMEDILSTLNQGHAVSITLHVHDDDGRELHQVRCDVRPGDDPPAIRAHLAAATDELATYKRDILATVSFPERDTP